LNWAAQREWQSLHQRLNEPGHERPRPEAPKPEAPSESPEAEAPDPKTQPSRWASSTLTLVVGALMVLLLFMLFLQLQWDGIERASLRARDVELALQQDRDRQQAREGAARLAQRITQVAAQSQTLLRPPSAYQHGRDLMNAGRWTDAEAVFAPLLFTGIPDALRVDVLLNSAQANAMAGNCNLMAARLEALRRISPRDPVLLKREALMRRCLFDRRARAQERSMALAGAG
jgi:hypothetical protein